METQGNLPLKKQHIVPLARLMLCSFTVMAFVLHLFTYEFSAFAYCIVLLFLVTVFVFAKPIVRHGLPPAYMCIWVLALGILVYNYLFRYRSNVVLIDVCVFLSGFVIIVFFSKKSEDYSAVLSVIRIMAIFFAVGVLIQRLIPSAYGVIIRAFPPHLQSSLRAGMYSTSKVKGFSTNTGFTAGYIIAGIFAVFGHAKQDRSAGKRNLFTVLVLVIALLMTGKRGPSQVHICV